MSNWFKKITGIAAIEEKVEQAEAARRKQEEALEKLKEESRKIELQAEERRKAHEEEAARLAEEEAIAKLSPKERATKAGEPWVSVLNTHVNEDNIRNGFFELDWNDLFVEQLRQYGYGTEADPEEEIVDRWFRDIVSQMLTEEGMDPTQRGSGYINVVPISQGKSEVS